MAAWRTRLTILIAVSVAAITLGAGIVGAATPPTHTSSCSPAETRAAFGKFLFSFDRGQYSKLDALFATAPDFQWFSSSAPGTRLRRDARDRRSLLAYFRSRHRHGDRLQLLDFHFTGRTPHWSNFYFDLRRRSSGYRDGRWFPIAGKGAIVCSGRAGAKFIVVSLGGPAPAG